MNHLNFQDWPKLTEKVKVLSHKYFYNFQPYKIFSSIATKQDLVELCEFASNPNVIVSRPGEGRGVVFVDRDRYIVSMTALGMLMEILIQYINLPNNFLRKIKYLNFITEERELFVSGSGPGRLYGLLKV